MIADINLVEKRKDHLQSSFQQLAVIYVYFALRSFYITLYTHSCKPIYICVCVCVCFEIISSLDNDTVKNLQHFDSNDSRTKKWIECQICDFGSTTRSLGPDLLVIYVSSYVDFHFTHSVAQDWYTVNRHKNLYNSYLMHKFLASKKRYIWASSLTVSVFILL